MIMASVPITNTGGPTRHVVSGFRTARTFVRELRETWSARGVHYSIAFIDVPLAMVATGLLGAWWAWFPLTALAVLAWPSGWWAAFVCANSGFVGSAWAYTGAKSLGEHPDERGLIEIMWLAFPCALVITGHLARRREAAVSGLRR